MATDRASVPSVTAKLEQDTDPTETIIQSLGGTFRKFQMISFVLFALPFALSGAFALNYVFTGLNLDYR